MIPLMLTLSRLPSVRFPASLSAASLLIALGLVGCGSASSHSSAGAPAPARATSSTGAPAGTSSSSTTTPAATTAPTAGVQPAAVAELPAAEHPTTGQFPATDGRTLQQLADLAKAEVQLGPATGVFVPGQQRLAFALTDKAGAFVYAPTAIYIANGPTGKAQGPFLAPADPMTVEPQYRSKENTGPGGVQAIYGTEVPVPHPGTYAVLALTQTTKGLIGSDSEIAVAAKTAIPGPGQRPPDIATDTLRTVHGDVGLLTTRIPPEAMHSESFNAVLGKRPIALLISTPQLCISRVCGPVTDVLVQLQHEFGHKLVFIHQEVYVDNNPKKGLRPQLKALHLETEPWLFTIDRHGVIKARLEGAFGLNEARAALKAALLS